MEQEVSGYFCLHCGSKNVDWDSCDVEDWINSYEKVAWLKFKCKDCNKGFEAGVSFKAAKFNFNAKDCKDDVDYVIKEV